MNELAFDMKQKKKNKTRAFSKRKIQETNDKQTEMNAFYQKIKHYPLNKIICLYIQIIIPYHLL